MCPVKWQRQYSFKENSTRVSTRAILIVPENIESNVKLDEKPRSKDKAKVADPEHKMDSIKSHIPKKAKEKHCSLCKKRWGTHTMHNTKGAGTTTVMGPKKKQSTTPSLTGNHVRKME